MFPKIIYNSIDKLVPDFSVNRKYAFVTDQKVKLGEDILRGPFTDETVVIKVVKVGICRADIKEVQGKRDILQSSGNLFGHEDLGEIVFIGDKIKERSGWDIGSKVVFNPNGTKERTTGFSNYMLIREKADEALIPVPEGMSSDTAIFLEPFSCVVRSYDKLLGLGHLNSASRVAIIGSGNAGLYHAWLIAKEKGAATTLFNQNDGWLQFIKERELFTGPTVEFLNDTGGAIEIAKEHLANYDLIIVTTTKAYPEILQLGLNIVKANGGIHIYGGTQKGDTFEGVDINSVRLKQDNVWSNGDKRVLISGAYGTDKHDFREAQDYLRVSYYKQLFSRIKNEEISLLELPEYIEGMKSGRKGVVGKVFVRP
jgi:cyclitol reductase